MFDKGAEEAAARFGILDRMTALESDLLQIEGISDIDFDLSVYPDCRQVIIVPKYDAGALDKQYYTRRHKQLLAILTVCVVHDLRNSGDRIEDYGEHLYIVRDCGATWPRATL